MRETQEKKLAETLRALWRCVRGWGEDKRIHSPCSMNISLLKRMTGTELGQDSKFHGPVLLFPMKLEETPGRHM